MCVFPWKCYISSWIIQVLHTSKKSWRIPPHPLRTTAGLWLSQLQIYCSFHHPSHPLLFLGPLRPAPGKVVRRQTPTWMKRAMNIPRKKSRPLVTFWVGTKQRRVGWHWIMFHVQVHHWLQYTLQEVRLHILWENIADSLYVLDFWLEVVQLHLFHDPTASYIYIYLCPPLHACVGDLRGVHQKLWSKLHVGFWHFWQCRNPSWCLVSCVENSQLSYVWRKPKTGGGVTTTRLPWVFSVFLLCFFLDAAIFRCFSSTPWLYPGAVRCIAAPWTMGLR